MVNRQKGSLSPWSQAVVVALLKMKEKHRIDMSFADIAKEVTKVGGGLFKEHCFDEDEADPWLLLGPCHKAALPPWLIEGRREWAQ